MSGYLNRPEATAETIVDGWLHTGDLGRMTESGFIYLLDRAKDMIISGGSNVYAVEVEDILARHPLIREVSVVGIPDDLWGESVVGVVVVEGTESLNFEALALSLTELAREHLAGYKIPRRFIFRSHLPRNAYGKVLKRELRATITEEMNSDLDMQQKGRLS
jgi:acyl-CoA synthetase (AMP-forming)/AMP-acid ligase II